MYQPLAERMIQKFVKEGKVEAEPQIKLYLTVLEMAGKFSDALEVLDGPLGGKVI